MWWLMWSSLHVPADNTSAAVCVSQRVKLDSSHSCNTEFFQPCTSSNPVCFPCTFTREITMSQYELSHTHILSLALGSLVWYSISATILCPKQSFPVCQPYSMATRNVKVHKTKTPENIMCWVEISPQWMQLNAFSCVRNRINRRHLLHFQYNRWNWSLKLTFGPRP